MGLTLTWGISRTGNAGGAKFENGPAGSNMRRQHGRRSPFFLLYNFKQSIITFMKIFYKLFGL
jgi:hypothetical protein